MVVVAALASCAILETGCTPNEVATGVIAGTAGLILGGAIVGGQNEAYNDGYYDGRRARRPRRAPRQVCEMVHWTNGFQVRWVERCYFVDASTGGGAPALEITPAQVRSTLGLPSDASAQLFMSIVGDFGRGELHPAAERAGYTVHMLHELMTTGSIRTAATTLEFARLADALGVTSQHLVKVLTAIRDEAARQRQEATSVQI